MRWFLIVGVAQIVGGYLLYRLFGSLSNRYSGGGSSPLTGIFHLERIFVDFKVFLGFLFGVLSLFSTGVICTGAVFVILWIASALHVVPSATSELTWLTLAFLFLLSVIIYQMLRKK